MNEVDFLNPTINKLNFFTPIRYSKPKEEKCSNPNIFESAEDYFSLGSKKIYLISSNNLVQDSQEVELKDRPKSEAKNEILCAIKIISYMTGIIPLIMLIVKITFRMTHKFHIISPESTESDQKTIDKVKDVYSSCNREEIKGLKIHRKLSIFSFETEPNLIFKEETNIYEKKYDRYQCMIFARKICKTYGLNLLVVPKARVFKFEDEKFKHKKVVIAAEKIDIDERDGVQEKLYLENTDRLKEAIRQLTVFVCKTNFSDIDYRNIPIVKNTPKNENHKIALVDLEKINHYFYNDKKRAITKLLKCVNEKSGEVVIKEAKKHLRWDNSIKEAVEKAQKERKKEIEDKKKLNKFYFAKGIKNGDELITLDSKELNLAKSYKGSELEKLKGLAAELINKINDEIKNSSKNASAEKRRQIFIDINHNAWNNSYLDIIIEKLINKKLIYKCSKEKDFKGDDFIYHIQA